MSNPMKLALLDTAVAKQIKSAGQKFVAWLKTPQGQATVGLAAFSLVFADQALAYTYLPWEDPICKVVRSLSGPIASAVAVAAVVSAGMMFAFSEHGGMLKTAFAVLGGAGIALGALNLMPIIAPGAFTGLNC